MAQLSIVLSLLGACLCSNVAAVSLQSYLSASDTAALKAVFDSAVSNPSDLGNVFFGIAGLKLLDQKIANAAALCDFVKSKTDSNNIESIFYSAGSAARLENCKLSVPAAEKTLNDALAGDITTQDLYAVVASLKQLGLTADNAKIEKALTESLKKDDSVHSLGYALQVAAQLSGNNLKPYVDRIEDMVAQADEVDGKVLQFDGGLSVTANAITGLYTLSEKSNATPSIKPEEVVKFANYLVNRKGAQLVRPAYHLVRALKLLATNKFHVPVAITRASPVAVTASEPNVQIKACNVMGDSVGALTVTVDTATHQTSSGVVLNKKAATSVPGDTSQTLYQMNFMEQRREHGFYTLAVSVASTKDKRLVGLQGEVVVKVLTDVAIDGVEVAVSDREQVTTSNILKVQYPSKIASIIEADTHQKVVMRFVVKDKQSNQPLAVHQAFVVFTHEKTNDEIVFVAESDTTKGYKFDVDLLKSAKEFDYLSGQYKMQLLIGDSVISNPLSWHLADVKFKFPEQEKASQSSGDDNLYKPKPEIKHMFREPEKRPPGFVSDTFTALVFVPLAILLVLWLRIGVNLSNFSFSLTALGFHLGLAGIFGLYFLFFLQFNMFQTLQYLAGIGGLTFLCGNAMLRARAEMRKSKAE